MVVAKLWIQSLKKSPILPWIVVFILLNVIVSEQGGQNPMSRINTLRAMVEQNSFQIDPYINHSADWSKTPDGHYYSNKAPGPMLLAFPVFWISDQLYKIKEKGYRDQNGLRKPPGYFQKIVVSVLFQVIPYALVVFFIIAYMQSLGISGLALHFTALALLFGNTATIFMNNYFGHGITAMFLLATILSVLKRKSFFVGLFFGLALLCDYSVALMLLPLVVMLVIQNKKDFSWVKGVVLGGVAPGILWIWYHVACFGSPFAIANSFQNPIMLDMQDQANNILGVFAPLPNGKVLLKLLFGTERGILFTQPWLILAIPTSVVLAFRNRNYPNIMQSMVFAILGLLLLLWMNASFGAWHGGSAAGPRYICLIFPVFALLAGLIHNRMCKQVRFAMWVLLIVTLIFRSQVYVTTILAPLENLWLWQWKSIINYPKATPWVRLLIFWGLMGIALWRVKVRKSVNA